MNTESFRRPSRRPGFFLLAVILPALALASVSLTAAASNYVRLRKATPAYAVVPASAPAAAASWQPSGCVFPNVETFQQR